MKISMGGEPLGARTHGGQDPPHRAGGSVDGSTSGWLRPIPGRCSVREWARIYSKVGEGIGIKGKNQLQVGPGPR
jgi:hypothetical protein